MVRLTVRLGVLATLLALGLIALLIALLILGVAGGEGAAASTPLLQTLGNTSGHGNNSVTLRARLMAAHLNSSCLHQNADCLGDAAFDAGFPQDVVAYGAQTCPGCDAWKPDRFQCVSFVLASYGATVGALGPQQFTHPLEFVGNADVWWGEYGSAAAQQLGYQEIPAGQGLPVSPGDIMAWTGGLHGHVSVVLDWQAPQYGQNGWIIFAQANGEMPIQTLPILPNLHVQMDSYWGAFTVQGYIHPTWLPAAA